jgi:CheY-like chemotaxis protein
VLLVDDDPYVLELFARMLVLCDPALEIVTASGGPQALAELRRRPPDLMLLDVVMPDMDGWQVLEAMAHDPAVARVPTLVVSAQDPADHPLVSRFFLATIDQGMSVGKLMRCALDVSELLLRPEGAPDPAPG